MNFNPPQRNSVDNQHRQIKGYRELNQAEIDLMNKIKAKGAELGDLVNELRQATGPRTSDDDQARPEADPRWVSIGATHLQQGLMALTRAVARPTFF
ncbi:MAG: hypothetical protein KA756_11710 [Steroidobacteraceae bacterium]|nr:hypothetical protein [Steroidobacteraceae bacterium]